jgi:transcription initiation factor TFIIE subunit alpha
MEYIIRKGESTDEDISRAFNIKLNTARQIIYKLDRNKLVLFRKEIDSKSNWVTYYWKPNYLFFGVQLNYRRIKIIEKLKRRYEYEKNNVFFKCPKNCIRLTSDEAVEAGFRCSKCNEVLITDENKDFVKFLESVLSNVISSETQSQDLPKTGHP